MEPPISVQGNWPPHRAAVAIALLVLVALVAGACGGRGDTLSVATPGEPAVVDAESLAGALQAVFEGTDVTTLQSALTGIDLTTLVPEGGFTLFAPDDEAFRALTADELADLLSDTEALTAMLRNHLVGERLDAAALAAMDTVRTEAGTALTIVGNGSDLSVGGARIVMPDREVAEGIIHTVDRLMVP